MPVTTWNRTIDLTDLFNGTRGFVLERRAEVAARLRDSGWPALVGHPDRLHHALYTLATDAVLADLAWRVIADVADNDRVRLETVTTTTTPTTSASVADSPIRCVCAAAARPLVDGIVVWVWCAPRFRDDLTSSEG